MLTGPEYADLDNALREQRGFRLVTTPNQYSEAHYLPNAYAHLKGSTPETVWTNGANIPAAWFHTFFLPTHLGYEYYNQPHTLSRLSQFYYWSKYLG